MQLRSWKGYSHRAMGSVTVALSDQDLEEAFEIGRRRFEGKDKLKSSNRYGDADTTLDGHILGASGEISFSRYFGLPIDKSINMLGDSGVDFVCCGISIDVQTTKHAPGWLKYDQDHKLKADVAVLVEKLRPDTFVIAGWVEHDELYNSGCIQDFGYGDRRTVLPDTMHSAKYLRQWITMNKGRYTKFAGNS